MERIREIARERKVDLGELFLKVQLPDGEWSHDSEAEFFADLPRGHGHSVFTGTTQLRLSVLAGDSWSRVEVAAPSRGEVQDIFSPFDSMWEEEAIPVPATPISTPEPVVFIGHGRSDAWRFLREHLESQHKYKVECYEAGARAGHTIRDILEQMASKSTFAFLVLTAEDLQPSGDSRARQNVVHEAGLFQGRLGFSRAVMLLEEGVEEFSNVQGVQYIPFKKGNIREAFGDAVATLRREFGGS
ncbi:putative nucleotide-binding protein containing TIR-like domain protein [compost metagenome]